MTNKKPDYEIAFDGNLPTSEEQQKAFFDLVKILLKLSIENEIKKQKRLSKIEKIEHKKFLNKMHSQILKKITENDKILPSNQDDI